MTGGFAKTARHLCLAVSFSAVASTAFGAELSVDPLRLMLDPATRSAPISVRNDDDKPIIVQVRIKAWSQPTGKDQLDDTRDLLVTPAVVEIPAHGSQTLRIGRRVPANAGQREQTYRILIKEVLPEAKPGATALRMALEISLPVFVAAPTLPPKRVEWQALREGDAIVMRGTNRGARHARFSSAELHDANGKAIGRWQGVTYLLSGATRSFKFNARPGTLPAGAKVTLRMTTEAGSDETIATLVPAGR